MENTTQTWSQDEFLAFIMLYGAKADMDFTADEQAWIEDKFGTDQFQRAKALYDSQSDYDNIQTMLQLKSRFFPGEHGTRVIKATLQELFTVDHHFNHLERMALLALEKLMNA